MVPFPALVIDQQELAPKVFRLTLRPCVSVADSAPGQFFMVRISDTYDPLLNRPLSFLRADDDPDGRPRLVLIYEVRGRGTMLLSSYLPGRSVSLIGPLGRGFRLAGAARAILVGGGIGAVPLYAAAAALKTAGADVTFIYGARTGDSLVLSPEIEATGAENLICTDDGCQGEKAFTTELLERQLTDVQADRLVLACGPRPMLKKVAALCREHKVLCQVSLEARMACGLGSCLTCVVRGAAGQNLRVCKEGPVFDAAELDWEALDDQA